jgi:hypothetical protein
VGDKEMSYENLTEKEKKFTSWVLARNIIALNAAAASLQGRGESSKMCVESYSWSMNLLRWIDEEKFDEIYTHIYNMEYIKSQHYQQELKAKGLDVGRERVSKISFARLCRRWNMTPEQLMEHIKKHPNDKGLQAYSPDGDTVYPEAKAKCTEEDI